MKEKAILVDKKWFYNNEINQKRAARFFYISSSVTVFFLFSTIGKIFLSLFVTISFYFTSNYFTILVAVFAEYGVFDGIQYMLFNVPLFFIILIVFVILLIDLTLINTFLVCCPSVSNRIKTSYGENFLKQQHYNSALASAKAAAQMSKHLAVGAAAGIIGGALTNIYGEHLYSVNYKEYLDATIKNPDVKIEPPKKPFFGLKIGH